MCHRNGITRKSASLLIAAVQFVHGFSTFLSATVVMKNTTSIAFLVVMIAAAMNMWLALVLCVGVNLNRPSLIFLWLGWAVVILVTFVVCVPLLALYAYVIIEQFKGANFATIYLMFTLSFFLHCFFVHVVYGYYEELVIGARLELEMEQQFGQHHHPGPAIVSDDMNPMGTCEIIGETGGGSRNGKY